MDWRDRPAYRKGQVGERIVDEWLMARGFVPYRSIADAAHPFDRIVASRDKRSILVVEVKSKPARNKYPDTGINTRHYDDYLHIQKKYGLRIFLAFVDERARRIYGEFLDVLERPRFEPPHKYPLKYSDIIYFPLSAMRPIAELSDEQATELAKLRRSKHDQTYRAGAA